MLIKWKKKIKRKKNEENDLKLVNERKEKLSVWYNFYKKDSTILSTHPVSQSVSQSVS